MIEVEETTVKLVAGFPEPKSTAVAPVKFVPVMVTLVPAEVITLTFTGPAAPTGETAVIEVEETTMKLVAGLFPKSTAVAPVKFEPVMVTVVSPKVSP